METEANKMTKQPSYRFAGYTESWDDKKLGKIGETFAGLSGKTKEDFGHGDAKFITYVNVFNNPLATLEGVDKIEIDEKQSQVNFGDVLFTTSSETPEEVGMSSVWLWDEENVYLNSFCFGYRPEKGIFNPYYLAFMLRSFAIRREFMLLAQGISRYNISKKKVMEMPVFLPSLSEQTAIGSFFQDIDQLISLQQRKLEVLKEQKKTYLKLLFPAKGQTKPALRFAGFEDEWKEVKLGEVTYIKTGGRDVQDSVEDGLYPFYIRSEEVKRINSYSFDGEAILIPGEGRLGEIFHYANGKFDVHQRVYKISNFTDVNAKFVLQQMKKDFKQHAMRNTVKATVDSLRLPTIQSFNILVPSLPEQTAIGSFFQDLDKAIAKQEEKVNQLKESKQTLLRKMFI